MWLLAALSGMLVWVGVMEIPPLWRGRKRKEWATLGLLTAAVSALGVAWSFSKHLPNPLEWLEVVFGPAARLLDALLN